MTAFLNGLRNESRDVAVSQLLHYLPLLRPANTDGVRGYIRLLPSLLASFLEDERSSQGSSAQHQSAEIQQLLTYALIHPAISLESKRSLAELIRHLDEDGAQEMALSMLDANSQGGLDIFQADADVFQNMNSQTSSQWDPWNSYSSVLASPQPSPLPPASSNSQRIRRSNSLTPPSNMAYPSDLWSKPADAGRMKPRSQSLSSPNDNCCPPKGIHCPLSPQNSLASSGSGSGSDSVYSDENHRPPSFQIPGSGMRDVPCWLKGLRLHKYAHLFSLMSYEEMLSLTEEQLEQQGVTKGARHKIALSIVRLRERPALLAQLEKEVVDTGNLQNALSELKAILTTPIKPYLGPPSGDDQLFVNSLTPSPLMMRDDTSGYSSLDGSTDNLAPRPSEPSAVMADVKMTCSTPQPPQPLSPAAVQTTTEMPTVIVSAAPDSDSAEEGSDSSGEEFISDGSFHKFSDPFHTNDADVGQSPVPDEDLPGQITRLLGKICTQLLVSVLPNEESISQFVSLLERCLNHEAFTQRQRRRFASWKEQAHRIWNTLPALGGRAKNTDSRYVRRWSNVAHYPGFYNESGNSPVHGMASNAFTLFPPRQQRGGTNNRQYAGPNSHNSYGQHHHLGAGLGQSPTLGSGNVAAAARARPLAPTNSLPLNHSLQVGSHLPLQHRNSFCVSALSQPHGSIYHQGPNSYSPFPSIDPFPMFHDGQHSPLDDLPSECYNSSHLGIQRARSSPMANGANCSLGMSSHSLFCHEKDSSDIDLNHRLESLCLSMTEHALEGANDS
nr:EOG090X06H8 [Polyphemus pediculus]